MVTFYLGVRQSISEGKIVKKLYASLCLLLLSAASLTSFAANVADANAEVVLLRKNCGTQTNCFDNMATLLDYIWGPWSPAPRDPSVSAPLLVDIGPGTFDVFNCTGPSDQAPRGWVTLRGSGQKITHIANLPGGDNAAGNVNGSIAVEHCTNLTIQDLTVDGDFYTIAWTGGGTSTWSNVEVAQAVSSISQNIGWYEVFCSAGATQAVHYWFGSKITTHQDGSGRSNYYSCGETWFYGGEITVAANSQVYGSDAANPIRLVTDGTHAGSIRLFGSAVRVVVPSGNAVPLTNVVGVWAPGSGTAFHMHGGIMSIDAGGSTLNYDVSAIKIGGGTAHAPETAFSLKAAGNGTVRRIELAGAGTQESVKSPYLWPNGKTPPLISSTLGSDLFVETDCTSTGNCANGAGGNETHLMIYNNSCATAGPWFDVNLNKCRGQ